MLKIPNPLPAFKYIERTYKPSPIQINTLQAPTDPINPHTLTPYPSNCTPLSQFTKIVDIKRLPPTYKHIYHLRLTHPIAYSPGDSIGLIVPNSELQVRRLMEYLNLKDRFIEVLSSTVPKPMNSGPGAEVRPEQIKRETKIIYKGLLSDYLRKIFNFRDILPKNLIREFLALETSKKEELKYLISKEGALEYFKLIEYDLIEILEYFQLKPEIELLIKYNKGIKPRYYSLINKSGESIEILVGIQSIEKTNLDGGIGTIETESASKDEKEKESTALGHVSSFVHNFYYKTSAYNFSEIFLGCHKNSR